MYDVEKDAKLDADKVRESLKRAAAEREAAIAKAEKAAEGALRRLDGRG